MFPTYGKEGYFDEVTSDDVRQELEQVLTAPEHAWKTFRARRRGAETETYEKCVFCGKLKD